MPGDLVDELRSAINRNESDPLALYSLMLSAAFTIERRGELAGKAATALRELSSINTEFESRIATLETENAALREKLANSVQWAGGQSPLVVRSGMAAAKPIRSR